MAIYSLLGIGGTGLGPVITGWIEMNARLQWRWIQWIHVMSVRFHHLLGCLQLIWAPYRVLGVELLLVITVMKETRSTIILTRLARKLRKETGNPRYRARAEDERGSLRTLIYISCTRPLCKPETVSDCWTSRLISVLDLLTTEPTVLSFSVSCTTAVYNFLSYRYRRISFADMVRFCMGHFVRDDRIQRPHLQRYPRI